MTYVDRKAKHTGSLPQKCPAPPALGPLLDHLEPWAQAPHHPRAMPNQSASSQAWEAHVHPKTKAPAHAGPHWTGRRQGEAS